MGLTTLQDGAPKIARLPYRWLNSMVYGRYNELVNGGYFMVYKPTNITGGPHPAACGDISCMAMCGSDT